MIDRSSDYLLRIKQKSCLKKAALFIFINQLKNYSIIIALSFYLK